MANHEMDNLSRDALEAQRAGMSYGKYMAHKQFVETQERQTAALKHERLPVCVYCGKSIPKGCRSRKYCSPECSERYRDRQKTAQRKCQRDAVTNGTEE